MKWRSLCSILLMGAGLSACAIQPRLYSTAELAMVAERCRVAPTEVAQFGRELELLYLLTLQPSEEQLDCVTRWAKRHGFTLVYVEAVEQDPATQAPDPSLPPR